MANTALKKHKFFVKHSIQTQNDFIYAIADGSQLIKIFEI